MTALTAQAYIDLKRMVTNMVAVGHINEAVGTITNYGLLDRVSVDSLLSDIEHQLDKAKFAEFKNLLDAMV